MREKLYDPQIGFKDLSRVHCCDSKILHSCVLCFCVLVLLVYYGVGTVLRTWCMNRRLWLISSRVYFFVHGILVIMNDMISNRLFL